MFRALTRSGLVASQASWKLQGLVSRQHGAARYLSDSISSGTVKWFDSKKGFGFIVPDDGSTEVFVHHSSIHAAGFRSLQDGEPVEYSVSTDDTGRARAENVTGPMGAYVQGSRRPSRPDSQYGHDNSAEEADVDFDTNTDDSANK